MFQLLAATATASLLKKLKGFIIFPSTSENAENANNLLKNNVLFACERACLFILARLVFYSLLLIISILTNFIYDIFNLSVLLT